MAAVELADRRRHERRERRVEVGDAVDDLAVDVEPEEPGVLAHQPVPVVAALGVGVGDADQRPVDRDLLRPQRVGAQRATAGLDDRGDRGDRGDVGEAGDPLGVPALAEQGAGADEDLAVAVLEVRRHQADPVAALPRTDEGCAASSSPRAARPGACRPGSASGGSHCWNASSVPGAPATVLPVTSIGASRPVSAPSTSAVEHGVGRAGLLVDDAGQVGGQGGAGPLVVAEHQHPHPVAEVEVLGAHDGHDGGGLGLAPGQHPVDRAAAAPDPALGPLVADRRQRAAYRLDDLPRPRGLPGLGEAAAQPVVDQQAPSRRRSAACGAPRPGGRRGAARACRRGGAAGRRGRPRAAP